VDRGRVRSAQPNSDAGATFDGLLHRYGGTEETITKIQANPIYRSLASALGGTQEYMAVERLSELSAERGEFDVVVIDTPHHAQRRRSLDAPTRLLDFLTHPIVRALLVPTRISLRAASLATAAVTRTIGTVVGAELVTDVVDFFQAFAGLHEGFVERAREVERLLADEQTAYVLVTTARADALEETRWFSDQLSERRRSVSAIVVNQLTPHFSDRDPSPSLYGGRLGLDVDALRELERQGRRERAALSVRHRQRRRGHRR
jgi:anion-transporting  ArsA/GET3 family ATPase